MKTKPLPATLGVLRWLTETRKNKAVAGDESPTLDDVAEMLLAFVMPTKDLAAMNDEQVKEAVEAFAANLTGEEFAELQAHAQSEFAKFTSTAVTPKKPIPLPENPTIWERIKLVWSVFFLG